MPRAPQGLRVNDVVKKAMEGIRNLHRQRNSLLGESNRGSRSKPGPWTQGDVAKRLQMSESTYTDLESRNKSGKDDKRRVNVSLEALVSSAFALETYPGNLLLPDRKAIERGDLVEIRNVAESLLSSVPARDFALWVLGLVELSGQGRSFFDVSGRVLNIDEGERDSRVVREGPMDPHLRTINIHSDISEGIRNSVNDPDLSSLNDVDLGMRCLSNLRNAIYYTSKGDSAQESSEAAFDALSVTILALGERLSNKPTVNLENPE